MLIADIFPLSFSSLFIAFPFSPYPPPFLLYSVFLPLLWLHPSPLLHTNLFQPSPAPHHLLSLFTSSHLPLPLSLSLHPALLSCCLVGLMHADISPLLCQQCSSTLKMTECTLRGEEKRRPRKGVRKMEGETGRIYTGDVFICRERKFTFKVIRRNDGSRIGK